MSKKLLLADDSVVIQKLVGLSFANEDVEIISTDNGDDAVTMAREVVPDVVLADVVMPGKTGYEVCEAIKRDPRLAHVPVLLLTGTFEAFDEARAASSGADGQITKPFEAQGLVARVTEVMNEAAAAPAEPVDVETTGVSELGADESDLFDANVSSLAMSESLAATDIGDSSDSGYDLFSSGSNLGMPSEATTDEFPGTAIANSLADQYEPTPAAQSLPAAEGIAHDESDFLLDEPGESRSALFGAPVDALEPEGSEIPKAPAIPDAQGDRSFSEREAPTAAAVTPVVEPPPLPEGAIGYEDPLAGLSDDFGLHGEGSDRPSGAVESSTPLRAASAEDVDTALATGSGDADPTILVASERSIDNANTQSFGRPPRFDASSGQQSPTATSASADSERQSDPNVPPALPTSYASAVAASERADAAPVESGFAPGARTPAVADLDQELADQDAEESSALGFDSVPNLGEASLLDLGPTNLAGDDLDFAFDVSEQQPVADLDDPLDRSYSSRLDLPEPAVGIDASSSSSALAGDYDVSSSDLATASTDPPSSARSNRWTPRAGESSSMDAPDDGLISVPDEPVAGVSPSLEDSPSVEEAYDAEDSRSAEGSPSAEGSRLAEGSPFAKGSDRAEGSPFAEGSRRAEGSVSVDDVLGVEAGFPFEQPRNIEESRAGEMRPPDRESSSLGDAYAVEESSPAYDFASAGVSESFEVAEDVPSSDPSAGLLVGEAGDSSDSASESIPDLSPMMEQRIQETLEKVAWEAFSDLSESIVKQVMGRVEKIAWEVIPQMAETLVREEIRRLKGEED